MVAFGREHTMIDLGRRTTSAAATMLVGALWMTSDAQAQQLSAAEFQSTHSGRCVSYSGPSVGTQCFGADGTTSYDDQTYGTDTGRWTMRGDSVCVNWRSEPGWDCGPITRTGAATFTDGEYGWTLN